MAITLPIGIRIVAGLLATTIDRLEKLPQELPTLALSLAGQTVRTSFRIRQEIAELATRGDELLSGITGRPQEKPEWATFDEDESEAVAPTPTPTAGARNSTPTTGASRRTAPAPDSATSARNRTAPAKEPAAAPMPTPRIRAGRAAATPRDPARVKARTAAPTTAAARTGSGSPLPGTGDLSLSIAALKEELRDRGIAAVRELLVLEESGPNRAAYLTLLTNRLTTLAHENGQSESR